MDTTVLGETTALRNSIKSDQGDCESRRVHLRVRRGTKTVTIPTDDAMLRIATDLHRQGVPQYTSVLGWNVFYLPACPFNYTSTEVDPFTGDKGRQEHHESTSLACCTFGHRQEWQASVVWRNGKTEPPDLISERGEVEACEQEQQVLPYDEYFPVEQLKEGDAQLVELTQYERNSDARRRCIEHYGPRCSVCGFVFEGTYGDLASGLIHVHHLNPLSMSGEEHEVDPVKDLRPVCPNCHSVLHLRMPPYSIEEVRAMLQVTTKE